VSRTPVDRSAVDLAVAGRVAFAFLEEPERRAAVRELVDAGMTAGGIADRLRTSPRQLQPYLPRRTPAEMDDSESAARGRVDARSGGVCERCGAREAESFSHRIPAGQGGRFTAANGINTCGDGTTGCHGWIEANPTEARRHGWRLNSRQKPDKRPALIYHGGALVRAVLPARHEEDEWSLNSESTSDPRRSPGGR
jgi:hypothetical protein